MARTGPVWQGSVRLGKVRLGRAVPAGLGPDWFGPVGYGKFRHGMAGMAGFGWAGIGEVRQGIPFCIVTHASGPNETRVIFVRIEVGPLVAPWLKG